MVACTLSTESGLAVLLGVLFDYLHFFLPRPVCAVNRYRVNRYRAHALHSIAADAVAGHVKGVRLPQRMHRSARAYLHVVEAWPKWMFFGVRGRSGCAAWVQARSSFGSALSGSLARRRSTSSTTRHARTSSGPTRMSAPNGSACKSSDLATK
eukprot:6173053-Pleurochrysis_carterae.AAC.6